MIRSLRVKFIAVLMTIVTILLLIIFGSLYYTTKMNYRQISMNALRSALMENPGPPPEAIREPKKFAVPSDSGAYESAPFDSVLPDSVLPDSVLPDSVLPDSPALNPPDFDSPGLNSTDFNSPGPNSPVLNSDNASGPARRREALPILLAEMDSSGSVTIIRNRLPDTVSDEIDALIHLVDAQDSRSGFLPEWNLRYLTGRKGPEQVTRYAFTDTYAEQRALSSQLVHSAVIGSCAFAAFFLVSFLLSRWVVRPVEEAWNRQRQFVADASHELKTPLTVILSNASMLSRSPELSDGKNLRRIENIQAESVRMKQLIESLLFLARSDAGGGRTDYQDVDFSLLASSRAMIFEPVFYDSGKTLSCEIQEDLHVLGDETKLRQLIDILLDNACKYSRDGSTVSLSLASAGSKEMLLSVISEGTPLTKEEQKQIFLRFYRANPSRSGPQGYGLGLAIASDIASEHHGKIRVQSEQPGRNCFSVRLPVFGQRN